MQSDVSKPNKNTVLYTFKDGAYLLMYMEKQKSESGKLMLKTDETVRNNENVIGIGMFARDNSCGVGTVVYDVMRNYSYPVLPDTEYYVTFGNYVKGQIIDIKKISTPYKKVPFSPDKPDFTATIRQDNQISVRVDSY